MFHTLMVSSEEHVMKEPGGRRPFLPSDAGKDSTPQMHDEWYRYEWDLPTCRQSNELVCEE